MEKKITRRAFTGSVLAAPTLIGTQAWAQSTTQDALDSAVLKDIDAENIADPNSGTVKRNASSFRSKDWRPYFSNLKNHVVLVDTRSRALHYWSEDGNTYRLFPTSVPESDDLTRLGRTSIIRKRIGPDWRPTANMLKRNPDWPKYIPAGPENPLGTHALYLTWQYYRIHGTHDTRKIGRRSSNGCIGLFNEHIAQLFDLTKVGTQVLLI
ncbi:L,D-transpeptidase [Amylibacter sp. SFDW26]|uniref:L,D-transpeptidase n=1 Tax=Amylibacter sp. SFDW26 TaxID=2652722 RepID=UPI001261B2E1|nr:L,D-transpeptidase [Amylibacter sp. SFDW26]KAB7614526.1 L,D-transpeptidase [Amylibacter sp. SFDW26]